MGNYAITSGTVSCPQKVVVYGPEVVGKTSLLSQFPAVLFIDTEESTKRLDVKRLPAPTSWTMLKDEVEFVIQNRPCKTLAIDTADWAERLCIRHVCDSASKNGVEDFGYGKGYVYVQEEFGRLLNRLEDVISAGINVAIAAHAQMRKFEQPDELGSYDRWEMKLSKQCYPLLKEWADAVLFATYKTLVVTTEQNKRKAQGSTRVMYTQHHACWDAKNRWGLPEQIPLEYAAIAAHIPGGVAQQPVYTPPQQQIQPPVNQPPTANTAPSVTPPPVQQTYTPTPPVTAPAAPPAEMVIPAGIPKELADLMRQNDVTPKMIQDAVAQKGWYPADTPIENYSPDFVNGALIAGWPNLYQLIMDMTGTLPF